mgnify:CR=1 FL=1
MNANGATDVIAIDMDPTADHGGCVVPATSFAILFFSTYQDIGVATKELTGAPDDPFMVAPNPVRNELLVKAMGSNDMNTNVLLHNVHGQLVANKQWIGAKVLRMDVAGLSAGLYLLVVESDGGVYSQKVMVRD